MIFKTWDDKTGNKRVGLWTTANAVRQKQDNKNKVNSIASLFDDVGYDEKKLNSAMNKARRQAESFGGKFKSIFDSEMDDGSINVDNFTNKINKLGKELNNTTQSASGIKGVFSSIGSSLKSVGKNILSGLGNLGISTAVSMLADFAIDSIVDAITRKSRLAEEAAQSAQVTDSKLQDLSAYKEQVAALKSALDSNNLSEAEAYQVRSQLLSIQSELIAKYGEEAAALDLISSSAQGAQAAMDGLGKGEMMDWLTSNTEASKNAAAYMNEKINISTTKGSGGDFSLDKNARSAVEAIVEKYGGTYKHTDGHGDTISMFDTTRENFKTQWTNMKNDIYAYCSQNGIDSAEIMEYMTATYNYVVDDNYNNNAETAKKTGEYLVKTTDQYADFYDTIQKKQEALSQAVVTGDQSAIQAAVSDYEALKDTFKNLDFTGDNGEAAKQYLQSTLQNLRADVSKESLKLKWESDDASLSNLKSSLRKIPEEAAADMKSGDFNFDAATDEQKQAYAELSLAALGAGVSISDFIDIAQNYGYCVDESTYRTSSYAKELQNLTSAVDEVASTQEIVNGAIEEQNATGTLTTETYQNLIALGDDYRDCIQSNGEYIQLNAERLRELSLEQNALTTGELEQALATQEAHWATNAIKINELSSGYETLTADQKQQYENLIQENQAISDNISQYELLIAKMNYASSGYKQWIDAQSAHESGEIYDQAKNAYATLTDGLESGKTGTVKFKAAEQFLIPQDVLKKSDAEIQQYIARISKYYQEGKDGVQNFLDDAVNNGLYKSDGKGNYSLAKNISAREFAKQMNLSDDAMYGIVGELQEYGYHFTFADESMANAIDSVTKYQTAVAELNKTDKSDALYAEKQKAVQKYAKELDNLSKKEKDYVGVESVNTQEGTVSFNSKKQKEAVESVYNYKTKNRTDTQKAIETYRDLTQQMRDLQAEGKGNTQEFETLAKQAAQTRSEIEEIPSALQELNNVDVNNKLMDLGVASLSQTISDYQNAAQGMENKVSGAKADYESLGRTLSAVYEEIPSEVLTTLSVHIESEDDFLTALKNGTLTKQDIETIQIALQSTDEGLASEIQKAQQELEKLKKQAEKEIELGLDTDKINAQIDAVEKRLLEFREKLAGNFSGDGTTEEPTEPATEDKRSSSLWEKITKTVEVVADTSQYEQKTEEINQAEIPNKESTVTANTGQADTALTNVTNKVKAIPSQKPTTISANVTGLGMISALQIALSTLQSKSITITASVVGAGLGAFIAGQIPLFGGASINGTAHVQGTAQTNGTAFANGNWGAPRTETALTGELGPELLVRGNKWYTIGDYGAEFVKVQKGDVIFNHKQTASLFRNGHVTGRGKAYLEGTAYLDGSGSSSDREETLDWIETKIDRIERAIQRLDTTAQSTFTKWGTRRTSLDSEIKKTSREIEVQNLGYKQYMKAADAVDLKESYKKKVQSGKIDIQTIKNEELANNVKQYQEYYEKALACKDAVQELKQSQAELYNDKFDLIMAQYEGRLSVYEHFGSMIDESISQSEAKGYITSTKYYDALIKNESKTQKELQTEKDKLLKQLQEGMATGAIKYGSQTWRDMTNDINDITIALKKSETAVLEYNNAIREIEWQVFDLVQDKISQITTESDFLMDLLSNKKLYDDKGKLTDEGISTMGLHGVNYNTYMAQADKYAEEIRKIDKDLAKDSCDQAITERRQESLELQQEMILSAEDEKNAIVDMVQEGIELELDALSELIDKYNEALDAEKDLYDYQKNVASQTKGIAALEKQMSAYASDTSEETKAKLQELKVSLDEAKTNLQETEYERYISDQKKLLDDLYNEYEDVLNQRLDDVDALISDMIVQINENAAMISSTLSKSAENVGYTLSDEMQSIWDSSNNAYGVLTTYSEDFKNWMTTLNSTIQGVSSSVTNMMTVLNKQAATEVKSDLNSAASRTEEAKTQPAKTNTNTNKTNTTANQTSSGNGKAEIGDKVKYNSGSYYGNSAGGGGSGSMYKGKQVYITSINKGSKYPYHISTGKKIGSGDLGWVKLSQLSGYATGKRKFNMDELAWTQEGNQEEYIIRPSDGAILTPIARKDSVLDHEASANLWSMANNPSRFVRNSLGLDTLNTPTNSNAQNNYTQNLGGVVINLPNVKNYEELLTEMQKDKNFERLINSMTIDRIAGKSALAKNKSIRS